MIKKILDLIFPQKCVRCGTKNEILCDKCIGKIATTNIQNTDNVFAVSNYNDPTIKKAIGLLKYRGVKTISKKLADLMYISFFIKNNIGEELDESIVVPIPLSKTGVRKRGFNQSELLAKHFIGNINDNEKNLSVTINTNVLYKKFHTDTQVKTKNRRERLINLDGSFGVKNNEIVKNKKIIIIDDVLTTGATMHEAKKTLKQAGAKKVIGLVVAKSQF